MAEASQADLSPSSQHPLRNHRPAKRGQFWIKSRALMLRRLILNSVGKRPASNRADSANAANLFILAQDRSPLFTVSDPREKELELGKVHNLRVSAKALDGLHIHNGEIFSFWHSIGRPTAAKGYVEGRELRSGCMIPTIAGGICQLTNALSRCAQLADVEIVERHKHTAAIDGLVIDSVTDATVFWNYLDLRFRPKTDIILLVRLSETELIVEFRACFA
jgi:vancomycin resistance protein YoaR